MIRERMGESRTIANAGVDTVHQDLENIALPL
jgi:hypothetical protein